MLSAGDDKFLSQLKRFTTPVSFAKSWLSQRQMISTGEYVKSKPDAADEKAMGEWRKQAGIPETPDGYLESLPEGIVFGEEDRAALASFLEAAHKADMPPEYAHQVLLWHHDFAERQLAEQSAADNEQQARNEDDLRARWGNDYRPNLNGIDNLFNAYGSPELFDKIASARMADGGLLGNDVEWLEFAAQVSAMIEPPNYMPGPDGGFDTSTIDNRLNELRSMMGDRTGPYWVGPQADQFQTEYRQLIERKERISR